jgi:hypothetical protein
MKSFLLAFVCLAFCAPALAQNPDEPPSRDQVILYLRTMHSHDLLRRTMEVQAQSMQQLLHDMMVKDTGKVPDDFDSRFKKWMEELIKGMPADEIVEAMIPAYQKHFTKSDIEAMSAFYSSPVGQKVLHELPAVMQEGNEAAMPIMSKYLMEWKDRMEKEMKQMEKSTTPKDAPAGKEQ